MLNWNIYFNFNMFWVQMTFNVHLSKCFFVIVEPDVICFYSLMSFVIMEPDVICY